MDRIDIWLPVEHVDYRQLVNVASLGEASGNIKNRVARARSLQHNRRKEHGNNRILNGALSSRDIQSENLSEEVLGILNKSAEALHLSPRAYHRVIKLARTIADLDEALYIETSHILEALQYRPQENK